MSIRTITYRGVDLYTQYGLIVQKQNALSAPERDVESVEVPGRNGNLILDKGRFKNRPLSYTMVIAPWLASTAAPLIDTARGLRNWLLSEYGYGQLLDSKTPGYFAQAAYYAAFDITEIAPEAGTVPLQFDAKPYYYSLAGQAAVAATGSPYTLTNPEYFAALPYIKLTGSGTGTLAVTNAAGQKIFQFTGLSGYIELDSEQKTVFKGTQPAGTNMITIDFPVLTPGSNVLEFTGGITRLDITPRWCSL